MNLTSAASIISQLEEPAAELKIIALQQLNEIVDEFWHEISDEIEKLKILYEDKSFEQYKLAGLLVSKIYFHLGSLEDSLTYALNAEELFDLNSRTEYVETILSKCIDCYTEQRRAFIDESFDVESPINPKLEDIINRLFQRCLKDGQYRQVLGLALDSRRLDILRYAITHSNKVPDMLTYTFQIAINFSQNRGFQTQVMSLLVSVYQNLENPDYISMFQCLIFLDAPVAVAKELIKLVQGNEDNALMSYQIAFDLCELGTQNFLAIVKGKLWSFSQSLQEAVNLTEDERIQVQNKIEKLINILAGKLTIYLYAQFLTRCNKSGVLILNNTKETLHRTVCHTGMVIANGFMHSGTTDDRFIRENYVWLAKMTSWAKTSAVASLGVIHRGQIQHSLKLLLCYMPGQFASKYTKSGFLYALGLIHANNCGDVTDVLLNQLKYAETEEERHGGCLALGLTAMGTSRKNVYDQLLVNLHLDEPCTGEAAGIAMGMVMLGSNDQIAIQDFVAFANESQHEKILRGLSVGIALTMYGILEEANTLIDRLAASHDAIIRRSAMHMMAMAYCGSGNTKAIKKLLHAAVSDADNDVRRAAVIGLGFILFKTPEQCPNFVSLFIKSFNPHVRYGAAMALGISCAGTGMREALDLLEYIINSDVVNFVRQGALIASAMILIQQNEETCPNVNFFRSSYARIIANRCDHEIAKFGAILAQGIIDAGGRNVTISLQSRTGHTNIPAVVGTFIFTQYWYWFPLAHCLSLAFTPTCVIAINTDTRMPKLWFKSNANPSLFSYPVSLEEKTKEAKAKVKVTILSMTKRMQNKTTTTDQSTSVDKEKEEKNNVEIAMKRNKPNPTSEIIRNPARVLKNQLPFMEFKDTRRFVPVKDISIGGIIMLKDLKPSDEGRFVRFIDRFAKTYEEEPQPPKPFEWSED